MAAVYIGLRPAPRPYIAGGDFTKAQPVAQRQFGRILDAGQALLAAADDENPAEAFPREPAESFSFIAIKQDDALARLEQLERGDNTRQPATDDHHLA